MRPELSIAAVRDLDEIWHYVAQDDTRAADRLIDRLLDSVLPLEEFPGMGVARDDLLPGLRALAVESYIVFYGSRPDRVMVERIFHARLDVKSSHF